MEEFRSKGYWSDLTTIDHFEHWASEQPNKVALIDHRVRLSFGEYFRRAKQLAAYFVKLGLTSDDVIAIQLPNWSEFAVAVNAAMLVGIPFCQFHSDFRSKEVGFILEFTKASTIVVPRTFRNFDHVAMLESLRDNAPNLKHILVVGDDIPPEYFDLRQFLDQDSPQLVSDEVLLARRPKGTDLLRTAFTSGTTGDPKAVLHIHSADNLLPTLDAQLIGPDSVIFVFLPVGLNWGFRNTLVGVVAGCTVVYLDVFRAEATLSIIEREKVTHFCCAPAHLVYMLNVPNLASYDLSSLKIFLTGGASCPIEVIREVGKKLPGKLLELYGMLESGTIATTSVEDDPEAVCGLVGRPWPQSRVRIIDDNGNDCPGGTVGEILFFGPYLTIGYYANPKANAEAFTPEGWFHTGDLGLFNEDGYLKIVGRKKEMIIRGGANIYPREIEEALYQHPKVKDAAIIGLPDAKFGERVYACVVPRAGERFTFEDMCEFLRARIATYKLPEFLCLMTELPLTPTGKVQKASLRDIIFEQQRAGRITGRSDLVA